MVRAYHLIYIFHWGVLSTAFHRSADIRITFCCWCSGCKNAAHSGLRGLGLSDRPVSVTFRPASLLAALLTVFHQTMVGVVTELDFWGDAICTVGFLGLLLLSLRHYSSKSSTVLFLIGTTIAAVIMAFSKEAGIVACGVPLLFAVRSGLKRMESFQGFTFAIALSLIVALFYLVVRSLIGTHEFVESHSDYYQLRVGTNVFVNGALAMIAQFSPISTVDVALGNLGAKLIAIGATAGIICLMIGGFLTHLRARSWQTPCLLWLLFFAVQGPVLLMPHLTEGNMARSIGIGWIATAVTLKPLALWTYGSIVRRSGIILALLWLCLGVQISNQKAHIIVDGQLRSKRFQTEIAGLRDRMRPDSLVFAVEDPGYKGYSYYNQPFFVDVQQGEVPFALREIFNEPDLIATTYLIPVTALDTCRRADAIIRDDGSVQLIPSASHREALPQ